MRKLIVNNIYVIAGFDHLMTLRTRLTDETFQDVCLTDQIIIVPLFFTATPLIIFA